MRTWIVILLFPLACAQSPAETNKSTAHSEGPDTVFSIAQRYQWLKDSVSIQRQSWSSRAKAGALVSHIRKEAAMQLLSWVDGSFYNYWYGTPWDFYGTTEVPQQGSIACGYFVSTVLRDLGFKLDRVAMAETYSEKFIRTLIQSKQVKRYRPFQLSAFVSELSRGPDQLCIAGLDNHVGFILVKNHEVSFLHSSVISPGCVVKEKAAESLALMMNHYLVLGSISADTVLMNQWALGK